MGYPWTDAEKNDHLVHVNSIRDLAEVIESTVGFYGLQYRLIIENEKAKEDYKWNVDQVSAKDRLEER